MGRSFSAKALIVLSLIVLAAAVTLSAQTTPPRQDECTDLLNKIKALQAEREAILKRLPPFDKMDIADVESNLRHRDAEIARAKSRRSLLECPGADKAVDGGGTRTGGETGGGTPPRTFTGKAPTNIDEAGISLKAYTASIRGASYREGDPQSCSLPAKDHYLEVGTPDRTINKPADLLNSEFTAEIPINGLKARAGSVGEDMQGYWGCVIAWNHNGLIYTVQVTVPYPSVEDNTPEKREELYKKCLEEALKEAVPFDKALRGLK